MKSRHLIETTTPSHFAPRGLLLLQLRIHKPTKAAKPLLSYLPNLHEDLQKVFKIKNAGFALPGAEL
jgi:hypothetical protein